MYDLALPCETDSIVTRQYGIAAACALWCSGVYCEASSAATRMYADLGGVHDLLPNVYLPEGLEQG